MAEPNTPTRNSKYSYSCFLMGKLTICGELSKLSKVLVISS
jgi:hypothetical protein